MRFSKRNHLAVKRNSFILGGGPQGHVIFPTPRWKWFSSTAQSIPVLEMIFPYSTVNSGAGNDFPAPHSQLQCWKSFSCTATSTPVLETIFLYSTVSSSAGNDFPVAHSDGSDGSGEKSDGSGSDGSGEVTVAEVT